VALRAQDSVSDPEIAAPSGSIQRTHQNPAYEDVGDAL